MLVENEAKEHIRKAIRPSADFRGLEEPKEALPGSAKADMALRPFGSEKDLWLAVQVKSRSRGVYEGNRSVRWKFTNVDKYKGMVVAFVSLQGGGMRSTAVPNQTRSQPPVECPIERKPKVWTFPGSSLGPNVTITSGGPMYDKEETRCTWTRSERSGTFLGDKLLAYYEEALAAGGSSANGICLSTFAELEGQITPEKMTEMETIRWLQPLFDATGFKTFAAEDPSGPYDIVVRDTSCVNSRDVRVQVKTPSWTRVSKFRLVATANSYRRSSRNLKDVPYHVKEFDIFLVGPPRNTATLMNLQRARLQEGRSCPGPHLLTDTEWIPNHFYLFCSKDYAELRLGDCDLSDGKTSFELDFTPTALSTRSSGLTKRLPHRYDMMCASSLLQAVLYFRSAFKAVSRPA
uniref:Uncharacterized protein n=1 Tax=Chromera velia CCMP2878 TaxID=1169474 RepID=A0A0G4GHP9_9ALVE|eukprot:Cvel_21936.t1-p1 / transcript=Cvel_21936.t1 / gene=Cvel_21936 / organism=Chromera_velia_CCMP2878 / gene_product=hypothetical protein / transcript_product=hypothetical protein / location=Cvel_scaffold2105:6774-7985(-) / protein_length=404 / sequence_SO=supercontig / SO=protein_coding / is_pseudo=false